VPWKKEYLKVDAGGSSSYCAFDDTRRGKSKNTEEKQ